MLCCAVQAQYCAVGAALRASGAHVRNQARRGARGRRGGLHCGAYVPIVPTEAINGRLEHLRGSALGFRNPTHCIARSLSEAGGFRLRLHPAGRR